ncbi:MAG: carbohydrate ABC transporter permease [Anaerolineae bacterium]
MALALPGKRSRLRRSSGQQRSKRFRPLVLWLIPILGLLAVFNVYPIFASLYLSLFDYEMLQPLKWQGLGNYVYAFTKDPVFITCLINTFYFAFVSVPLGMAVSLLVAQFIYSRRRFKSAFRTIYFLPVVTPMIGITFVWRFILLPSQFGMLNAFLRPLGVPPQPWLTSAARVMPALIGVSIWAGMGYNVVLFIAGLVGIPNEFYEAAKIDGANAWQMFTGITWPLLSPTVLFTTVTGSIGALQIFSLPYVMTRGGPENASRTVVMWVQEVGFKQFRMGYASSLAYIFFVAILILTVIELRYLRTRWSY